MLGVVFSYSVNFRQWEIIVFNEKVLCAIEDIDSLKSNLKIYFTSPPIIFEKVWEFENCQFDHALD